MDAFSTIAAFFTNIEVDVPVNEEDKGGGGGPVCVVTHEVPVNEEDKGGGGGPVCTIA